MAGDRPNIVFVLTDQQRYDTIAALGATHMDTPNLDRLVTEGVAFTDCHVTAPSCAPSRASLFTGHYPHTTGIYRNGDRWTRSWVEDLSDAGYYTVNVGKMHAAPYDAPMGFDERYEVENTDRYLGPVPGDDPPLPGEKFYLDEWDRALQARGLVRPQREFYRERDDYDRRLGAFEWDLPEDMHPDRFVGEFATRWLDRQPTLDPLFLQVGFPGPHPPFDPPGRLVETYRSRDLPMPTAPEPDLDGQPDPLVALREHHQTVDHDSVTHDVDATDDQLRRQRAHYYAGVSLIDEQVGELIDSLEANGYEDTVVVFASDHGEALGDHGHVQKWTMYDVVTRVPAVVWSPGRFAPGTVEDLVSLFDLGPTVLDLAGVPVPESVEAESLLPALCGTEGWRGRDAVFAEHARDGVLRETEFVSMVRTEEWKLIHFVGSEGGQLFDLTEDPEEVDDRWDDPAVQSIKRDLLDRLLEWRIRSGVRAGDWAEEAR